MKRFMRLGAIMILVAAFAGVLSFGGSAGAADDATNPYFDSLTPAPYTTVPTGPVLIGAHVYSDAALSDVKLSLGGAQIEDIGSATDQSLAVSQQRVLTHGVYTATVVATDADGKIFKAQWDFVVSDNAQETEWFNGDGTPKADQINATMRSLVQAFRWHLYGLSWDGANHPDLPSHVGLSGTGEPLSPWVTGTTFDQSATTATLKSLVEAFRWHFWGISWDGQPHCDVPTHADCNNPQPPQSIDPWFTNTGAAIPANISATLRSLVEAFRWHFWGYSWDGQHHPDMPTHQLYSSSTPPASTPTEGSIAYQSNLTAFPPFTSRVGTVGAQTASGYSLTVVPNVSDGITIPNTNFGDASYSLTMRKLTTTGTAASCLMFRIAQTQTSVGFYQFCFQYSDNSLVSAYAMFTSGTSGNASPTQNNFARFDFNTALAASNWNTLKVIAQGNQFWFYVNGGYLGTATNTGTTAGAIGFAVYNGNGSDKETIEYTNVIVKNLQ